MLFIIYSFLLCYTNTLIAMIHNQWNYKKNTSTTTRCGLPAYCGTTLDQATSPKVESS